MDPKIKRLAILTEDHPVDYLLFEGSIPRGSYGAGTVIVWDIGTYSLEVTENKGEDVSDQFNSGKINFTLFGQKLKGKFSIIKTSRENHWLLIKVNDKFSLSDDNGKKEVDTDLIKIRPESVLSGLTNSDLKKSNTDELIRESKSENKIMAESKDNSVLDIDTNYNTNSNTAKIDVYADLECIKHKKYISFLVV
jgi:bifunctional non-homologous end joining protein LigD